MNFENKRILVVGLGKSGTSAVEALYTKGARVYVLDDRDGKELTEDTIKLVEEKVEKSYLGGDTLPGETFDYVVVSPGVALEKKVITEQKEKGAVIMGELELAYQMCSGKFLGITGTNGKTTTTTLVGEIFGKTDLNYKVVGNIGLPVVTEVIKGDENTWYVTEISSFQLESIIDFKPKVSAVLNLTPDHIDRHKTFENYGEAKSRITENQSEEDFFIRNLDDEECKVLGCNSKANLVYFSKTEGKGLIGAFVKDQKVIIRTLDREEIPIIDISEIPLPGTHNLENVLAAVALCYFSGIDRSYIREGIVSFAGVEHRVEVFAEKNGIKFINDSKGTNPDATIKAVEAMNDNIILVAGGYDKDADFSELLEFSKGKVKTLLLLGQTKEKIAIKAVELGYEDIYLLEDLEECVEKSKELAGAGDKILLSPACASWGMYPNYEVRGKHFKELVSKNFEI